MESIFETKEQYLEFVKAWKASVNTEDGDKLTLQHYVLYAQLRGKDISKCLSPASKDETLADVKYWTQDCNPKYLSLWPFGDTITVEMIEKVRAMRAN